MSITKTKDVVDNYLIPGKMYRMLFDFYHRSPGKTGDELMFLYQEIRIPKGKSEELLDLFFLYKTKIICIWSVNTVNDFYNPEILFERIS